MTAKRLHAYKQSIDTSFCQMAISYETGHNAIKT